MAHSGFPPTQQQPERRKAAVTHEDLEEGRKFMAAHFDDRFDALEKLIREGFPNGDPRSHREVHEGYIKDAADRAALWKSIRDKLITSAVYAGALLIASAVWEHITSTIKAAK